MLFGSSHAIFSDVFDIKRMVAKFFPKFLSSNVLFHEDQVLSNAGNIKTYPNWLRSIITDDAICVSGYDVEIKAESSLWKHSEEFSPEARRINKE